MAFKMDDEDIEDLEKAAASTLVLTKSVLTRVTTDPEFSKLQARHWRQLFDAAKNEGFDDSQALHLVGQTLRASGK